MSISRLQDPFIVRRIEEHFDDPDASRNCPDIEKAARCFSYFGGADGEAEILGWDAKEKDYVKLDPKKEFDGELSKIAFGEESE